MSSAAPFSRLVLALIIFFSVCVLLSLPLAAAPETKKRKPEAANHIVISEIQISGDGGDAANDEFVELYNPTNSPIVMSGWRLTRKNSSDTQANLVANLNGTIPSRGYFLIGHGSGYNGGATLDIVYSAPSNALTNNYTVLLYSDAGVTLVDKVAFGGGTDPEGSAFATNPSANNSIERKAKPTSTSATMAIGGADEFLGNGEDTDNNSVDFVSRTISQPQNSSSIPEPIVATSTPTDTPANTVTFTPPLTATPTETFTPGSTPTVTDTPTDTPTDSPTNTPTDTPTNTLTFTPTDTPTNTPTNTPTPTFTPLPSFNPLDVVINEVAWSGTTASANAEWIELHNNTNTAIDLTGWTLQADDGTPNISLSGAIPAFGYFLLERTADSTVSDIAADKIYTGAMGNGGEQLRLRDPASNEIDSANGNGGAWSAGTDSPRCSMERIDATQADTDVNWATNNNLQRNGLDAANNPICGTPKNENSAALPVTPTATFTFTPTRTPTETATLTMTSTPAPSGLYVNEFMPAPAQDWNNDTIADDNDEWIEIYNANAFSIDLSGWKLDDVADGGSAPYTLANNTIIAANSFLLFYRASTNIALNNTNDDVRLLRPDNVVADMISYKTSQSNASWARVPDGANYFSLYCPPTPGASNCSIAPTPTLTPTPFAKQIFINEFLPAPYQDWNHDQIFDSGDEWIELYNASNHAVDLSDWRLDDAKNGSAPYKIPAGTILAAHEFLLFFASETGLGLNNDGDVVRLLYPDNSLADRFKYTPIETNQSYARYPDSAANWVAHCQPTPGAPNCAARAAPTPTRVFNLTTIAQARALPLGSKVSVLGSIIAHPCEFDLYGHELVLSDGSAGIAIYMGFPARMSCLMPRHEQIVVTGVISDHYGLKTIYPESNLDLTRHYNEPREIAPRAVHTGDFGENVEALLVTIQGKISNGKNGDTLWVNDGTGAVEVYADEFSHTSFEGIPRGSILRITGIGYQYNGGKLTEEGYYLRVRAPADVIVLERAEKAPEAPGKRGGVDLGAVAIDQALATNTQNYVTVGGVVTMPPGVVDDSDFWLQDASGGIHVFVAKSAGALPTLKLHDQVSVRGRIVNTFGARELRVELPDSIGAHGAGVPVAPRVLKTGQVDFSREGALAQIVGWVARSDGREIYVDDGSGQVLVYIDADTQIRWPRLRIGDPAIITGIITRFRGAPEILPRVQSDVQFGITLLPVTGAQFPAFLRQLRARGDIGEALMWTQKLQGRAAHNTVIRSPRIKKAHVAAPQPERVSARAETLVTALALALLIASGMCGIRAAREYRKARLK